MFDELAMAIERWRKYYDNNILKKNYVFLLDQIIAWYFYWYAIFRVKKYWPYTF